MKWIIILSMLAIKVSYCLNSESIIVYQFNKTIRNRSLSKEHNKYKVRGTYFATLNGMESRTRRVTSPISKSQIKLGNLNKSQHKAPLAITPNFNNLMINNFTLNYLAKSLNDSTVKLNLSESYSVKINQNTLNFNYTY